MGADDDFIFDCIFVVFRLESNMSVRMGEYLMQCSMCIFFDENDAYQFCVCQENPYPCNEDPEFLETQLTIQNSFWFACEYCQMFCI